ncbi:hypothetical protein [Arcobacter sp. FWKO B]|uniref:hypothetical protein n=1 Tax=Arcobacter sp. FWKO B TaxID=2593672 RepID=UPI0018A6097B|nr:hypothetical protein [Arcobacter sp. FWKO B]QOG12688.1 hypothetical protein FWKOB_08240 [Arcobacter sp. FWKO B]
MAKIDLIKEKINYLKVWLGIFVVTLIGLVGWLSSNYDNISSFKFILSFLAVILLVLSIHFLNKKILEKINSLEEL